MFMQKIEMAAVTCDLFGVTKGFDGTGGGGVDAGKGPRTATEAEARAYADFIRRKSGAPDLGKPAMHTATIGSGAKSHFHYVGATYGEALTKQEWCSDRRETIPAEYEPGAFSVLFPGANQMRATVTLETLGDDGEAISSQAMPVDPKKGGVVWSKDDVRKACGPIAKVKAARTPTVAKRRAAPTVDKRRRAVILALRLRKQLRRAEKVSSDRFREIMRLSREPQHARPDAPKAAPDAILSDLAAAEALMRGEGYVAPAPVYAKPERARIRSTVIGNLQYGRLQEEAFVIGQAGGFEAMTGSDPAAWHWQREGRSTAYGEGLPTREDALAALDSFLAGKDASAPTVGEPEATPTAIQRPKRTPAHERAIRRAWAERKARRMAQGAYNGERIGRNEAVQEAVKLRHWHAEISKSAAAICKERDALGHKRRRAVMQAREAKQSARHFIAQSLAHYDRAINAEDEARHALAAREDLKRMLAATESRLAAAEAENAQLWAEIEGLTAPVPALAA